MLYKIIEKFHMPQLISKLSMHFKKIDNTLRFLFRETDLNLSGGVARTGAASGASELVRWRHARRRCGLGLR